MQPSGEFGIGLHSAFLLMKDLPTDQQKITIYTKSRITHESLKIELNSPLSGKTGYCFIEKINDIGKYGSTILIREQVDKVSSMDNLRNRNAYLTIQDLALYKGLKIRNLEFLNKILQIKNFVNSPLILIKYDKKFNILNSKPIDKMDINEGYFWSSNTNSAIKFSFIDEGKETTTFSRSPIVKYRGQYVSSLERYKVPENFPNIFKFKTFFFTIDMYGGKASKIISLSRESVVNEEIVNFAALATYKDLISHIENNNDNILDKMFDSNSSMSSLFMKFGSRNLKSEDDFWKNVSISNDGYILNDILNSKGFACTRYSSKELAPLSELLNLKEFLTFESYLMDSLLENESFQTVLSQEGFSKYKVLDKKIAKHYSLYIYLKEPIREASTTLRQVSYNHISSKLNTIEDFYKLFNFKHIEMPSSFLQEIIQLIHEDVTNSFLDEKLKQRLFDTLNNNNVKGIIIVPFLINRDSTIIEIPNENLIELAIVPNELKSEIEQIYTDLKRIFVQKSKEQDSHWYKSYLLGKNFKPIDLSNLN